MPSHVHCRECSHPSRRRRCQSRSLAGLLTVVRSHAGRPRARGSASPTRSAAGTSPRTGSDRGIRTRAHERSPQVGLANTGPTPRAVRAGNARQQTSARNGLTCRHFLAFPARSFRLLPSQISLDKAGVAGSSPASPISSSAGTSCTLTVPARPACRHSVATQICSSAPRADWIARADARARCPCQTRCGWLW